MSPKASGNPIRLSQPTLGEEEQAAANAVLRSGRLTQGPQVEAFETEFAELTGSPHAVAVSSGTSALILALLAMEIQSGDEVVVPAYTFIATANAVSLAGGRVVLADIEPESYNLDPASLKEALGPRTHCVILVHQFGLPMDVERIRRVAGPLQLLEDAACAAGALGAPAGRAACFSFHPRKVITTGEGGMVTTGEEGLARKLRALRQHGGDLELVGYNFRMPEISAAVGRVQLRRLPDLLARRRRAAALYRELLSGLDWLVLPDAGEPPGHVFQSYVVRLCDRAPLTRGELLGCLSARGIECQAAARPVHRMASYREVRRVSLPVAESAGEHALFLPMHAGLSDRDVETVCQVIKEAGSR
jgi:dTDP-4-amino-4,6-dideoxygalactose transaminase